MPLTPLLMNEKHNQTIHLHSDAVNGEADIQLSHASPIPSPVLYVSHPTSPCRSVMSRTVPIIENEDTHVFPDDEPPSMKPDLSNSGPSDITTPKPKWLRHSVEEVNAKEQSSLFSPVARSVASTASDNGNGFSKNDVVISDDLQPYWTLNPPSPPAGALSSPEVQSRLELDALPTTSPTLSAPISLSTIAPIGQVVWSHKLHKAPIEPVKSFTPSLLAPDLVFPSFDKGNISGLNTQAPDLSSSALMHELSSKFNASMDLSSSGAHPETKNDQWYFVEPTYQKAVTRPSFNSSSISTSSAGPYSRISTIESPLSASTVAALSLSCRLSLTPNAVVSQPPQSLHKLWDLDLRNVEANPYIELRAASLLPPPTLKDILP
ncbi:hypothetical protein GG344DRAFT_82088 [Lentinula edodes]|nr:hypothetical protein GG344DRAFT_82088 [Lentinula edodes]